MAEFVIIGGGIYGCGVAWELARQGAEVCLLEAKTVASGASGGLGKRGVRANGRDLRELPLMALAYDRWPGLAAELGVETGYERLGHLMLIEREIDWLRAETQTWMQTKQGIPSVMLGRAELREREPLVSERVLGALFCPKDGVADHTATTRGFAKRAVALGADIREHTPVASLVRRGDVVTGVLTAEGAFVEAQRGVLLLSNYHSKGFVAEQLGLTLPVWSLFPQVMLTAPLAEPVLHHLIGHAGRRLAMKPAAGGRVMISGGWHGDPGRGNTIPAQIEGNRAEAVAVYPSLAGVPIELATADRPELISVDDVPIIDYLPGARNVLLATGWSGHGWAIAPAVCGLLAEWVVLGSRPGLLEPFSLKRFS